MSVLERTASGNPNVRIILPRLFQECQSFVQECYTTKTTGHPLIDLTGSSPFVSTPRRSRQLKSIDQILLIIENNGKGEAFLQNLWYAIEILKFVLFPDVMNVENGNSTSGGVRFNVPGLGMMLNNIGEDDLPNGAMVTFITLCEEMLTIFAPFYMNHRPSIYRVLNKTLLTMVNSPVEIMKRIVGNVVVNQYDANNAIAKAIGQQMQRRSIFPLLGGDEGLLFATVKHNHIHHYPFIIVTILRCFAACSVFFPISYGRSKNKSGDDQGFITEEMLGESFINQSSLLAEFLDTLHEKLVVSKEWQWERYSANTRHLIISALLPLSLITSTSPMVAISARLLLRTLLHVSFIKAPLSSKEIEMLPSPWNANRRNPALTEEERSLQEYFQKNRGRLLRMEEVLCFDPSYYCPAYGNTSVVTLSLVGLASASDGLMMMLQEIEGSIDSHVVAWNKKLTEIGATQAPLTLTSVMGTMVLSEDIIKTIDCFLSFLDGEGIVTSNFRSPFAFSLDPSSVDELKNHTANLLGSTEKFSFGILCTTQRGLCQRLKNLSASYQNVEVYSRLFRKLSPNFFGVGLDNAEHKEHQIGDGKYKSSSNSSISVIEILDDDEPKPAFVPSTNAPSTGINQVASSLPDKTGTAATTMNPAKFWEILGRGQQVKQSLAHIPTFPAPPASEKRVKEESNKSKEGLIKKRMPILDYLAQQEEEANQRERGNKRFKFDVDNWNDKDGGWMTTGAKKSTKDDADEAFNKRIEEQKRELARLRAQLPTKVPSPTPQEEAPPKASTKTSFISAEREEIEEEKDKIKAPNRPVAPLDFLLKLGANQSNNTNTVSTAPTELTPEALAANKAMEDYKRMMEHLQQLNEQTLGEAMAGSNGAINIGFALMTVAPDEILSIIFQMKIQEFFIAPIEPQEDVSVKHVNPKEVTNPLPVKFSKEDDYIAAFQPLLVDEFKASLKNSLFGDNESVQSISGGSSANKTRDNGKLYRTKPYGDPDNWELNVIDMIVDEVPANGRNNAQGHSQHYHASRAHEDLTDSSGKDTSSLLKQVKFREFDEDDDVEGNQQSKKRGGNKKNSDANNLLSKDDLVLIFRNKKSSSTLLRKDLKDIKHTMGLIQSTPKQNNRSKGSNGVRSNNDTFTVLLLGHNNPKPDQEMSFIPLMNLSTFLREWTALLSIKNKALFPLAPYLMFASPSVSSHLLR